MSQESDEPLKTAIALQLERLGFTVTAVLPFSGRLSPDFVAEKAAERFVFELKERVDDPDALAEERARLAAGELVPFAESAGRNKGVSEKIRYGAKQLQAHDLIGTGFRLLWLHAGGRNPEVQFEQFRATLYGMTHIVAPELARTTRCYYFGHSEFFRLREHLAGAVISTLTQLQLCINALFPQVSEFRKSALVETFSKGLLDPDRLEREGNAFVADCDIDRKDEAAVLMYLQAKFRRPRLMNMNLGSMGAQVLGSLDTEGIAEK
jgi:Holliday junction resolvase